MFRNYAINSIEILIDFTERKQIVRYRYWKIYLEILNNDFQFSDSLSFTALFIR